jgi:two-component system, sensor histidine kinase and response regulator
MSCEILVLDPCPARRTSMVHEVEALGYRAASASEVDREVQLQRQFGTDLVLFWPELKREEWRGEIARLRAAGPQARPVVVCTHTEQLRTWALQNGADDALLWPFDQGVLAVRLARLLEHKRRFDELHEQNCRLQHALEQQLEMFQFVLHDLRSPTAVVQSNVTYALEALETDATETREALQDAAEATRRIRNYVNDLLTIGDEQPGLRLQIQRFPLADLVSTITHLYQREAALRGVLLDHGIEGDLLVEADRELLRRVLENLVENALRHTAWDGRIHLSATADEDVRIAVSNTGKQIPLGERSRIFERYVGGSAQRGGVGIGLYFCKKVLAEHHGAIWVEERAGWPVTFALRLPRRVRRVVDGTRQSERRLRVFPAVTAEMVATRRPA